MADWRGFLACWQARPAAFGLSVLRPGAAPEATSPDTAQLTARRERELGVRLPPSYRHFLEAFQPDGAGRHLAPGARAEAGMFPVAGIDRMSVLYPDVLAIAEPFPIASPDEEYFRYGIDQDDSSGRNANLREALVVGRYGDSLYELILLYPQVRTRDGEMEAALLFHSGQFRAPSFAELMRQLHMHETGRINHVPPFPQATLRDTCAQRLPLAGVWWK